MILSGRLTGPCYEGLESALAFWVGEGAEHERILLSRKPPPLPSLSPFVWYEIEAEPSPRGPFWRVLRVLSAEPLPVHKTELVDFACLALPRDSEAARASLERDLASKRDPLGPGDVPARQSIARELVADAWLPSAFYRLLPYFPACFLRSLDEIETEIVAEMFDRDPATFAHWEAAARALAPIEKSREIARVGRPFLSADQVGELVPEHREAFEWAERARAARIERGELIGSVPDRLVDELAPYYAMFGPPGGRIACDVEDARAQAELALRIESLDGVEIVSCRTYDAGFSERISALAAKAGTEVRAARPAIASMSPRRREATVEPPRHLALFHAHKLGPGLLLSAIGSSVERLTLIGDPHEMPAHGAAGGGDVFRDLWEAASRRETWPSSPGDQAATLASLDALTATHLTTKASESERDLCRFVADWVASIKARPSGSEGGGERSWVVACSTEERRARLRDALFLGSLRLGQRLHLLETDEVGTLRRAASLPAREVAAKKGRLNDDEDYEMHLDAGGEDVFVPSRRAVAADACDVALSSLWIGPMVDSVLFVADASTSLEEIGGLVKYSRRDFALALAPSIKLADLPRSRARRSSLMPSLLERIEF